MIRWLIIDDDDKDNNDDDNDDDNDDNDVDDYDDDKYGDNYDVDTNIDDDWITDHLYYRVTCYFLHLKKYLYSTSLWWNFTIYDSGAVINCEYLYIFLA